MYQQSELFEEGTPEWVEVDLKRLRVERSRDFGGGWLGLELARRVGLVEFVEEVMPTGREDVPWSAMALVLVLCRLCEPSSELRIAEHLYERSGLADLLGVPADKVNDDRMYRALDALLPHKAALEAHLAKRLGELFELEYDLLLYDMTSTYFEGDASGNDQARRGYSRDHRPDCKQVTIAMVVSRCGLPLAYEVFDGNRNDATTVEAVVGEVERRYGRADRIWVMDRGMVSEDNIAYLKGGGRRYILGTPRCRLRQFERHLLSDDWQSVRDGLEVKLCPGPDGDETFILCRSADRREKERAMQARFSTRIEEGLEKLRQSCLARKQDPVEIARKVGRLMGRNTRGARFFNVEIGTGPEGEATLAWSRVAKWSEWAQLSEGCYLLRTNVTDWSAEELWHAYTQLTEAEEAFRIHKSDLSLRPVWHQSASRVQAHILVCFLAYVLWKTLAMLCRSAGLGTCARKAFDELAQIKMVDVVLPTSTGAEIRKRCVVRPDAHQAILIQRLRMKLPRAIRIAPL
jgi:hypothetical protein